jgi:beta-alanine degradation protein BauB
MNTNRNTRTLIAIGIVCGGLGVPAVAAAEDVPLSYVADPGVYKLLAENELFRVVLATWKPGQRDAFHSHSANAAYRLLNCRNRAYGPDGKVTGEGESKAGSVILQNPIAKHSVENIGSTDCQVLIVERK